MREEFLKIKQLGNLKLIDVFAEYDHPLLFVCEDKFNSLYLIVETKDSSIVTEWIASRITENQYHDIVGERQSFESIFRMNCNDFIYLISDKHDNDLLDCVVISELPDLPTFKGDTLISELGYSPSYYSLDSDPIIEFEAFPNQDVNYVSLEMNKAMCDSVAGMVKSKYGSNYYVDYAIPRVASFGFRFIIRGKDILPFSENVKVAKEIAQLVTSDSESMTKENYETISSLNKLFKTLKKYNADVIINTFQNDRINLFSKALSSAEILKVEKETSDYVQKYKYSRDKTIVTSKTISGILYAYDIKNKRYAIKTDKDFISGTFSALFDIETKNVGLNCEYSAKIQISESGNNELLELISLKDEQLGFDYDSND